MRTWDRRRRFFVWLMRDIRRPTHNRAEAEQVVQEVLRHLTASIRARRSGGETDLAQIVQNLAKGPAPCGIDTGQCVLCEQWGNVEQLDAHAPDCPWRLARIYISAKGQDLGQSSPPDFRRIRE
jgi:hypothetical protein